MLDKDVSILVQVAFKEASANTDFTADESLADFETLFSYLTESLVSAVKANIEAHATSTNVPRGTTQPPRRSAEQAIKDELGGTALPFQVEIKKGNGEPAPAWLAKACEAVGCTAVWDNRDQLSENPNRPWFRAADGTTVWNEKKGAEEPASFWPPKKGGARKGGGQRRAAPRPPANDPIYGDEEPF